MVRCELYAPQVWASTKGVFANKHHVYKDAQIYRFESAAFSEEATRHGFDGMEGLKVDVSDAGAALQEVITDFVHIDEGSEVHLFQATAIP